LVMGPLSPSFLTMAARWSNPSASARKVFMSTDVRVSCSQSSRVAFRSGSRSDA
jgi:hypothetical protein